MPVDGADIVKAHRLEHRRDSLATGEFAKIYAEGAHRRGDGHLVVVEHDGELTGRLGSGVHRLIGHARADGAVADHGDDAMPGAALVPRHGETQRRRDRRRRMGRAEGVKRAFRPAGEAGQAPALTKRAHALTAPGEDLVRIGLMADVPDENVVRRIEDVM